MGDEAERLADMYDDCEEHARFGLTKDDFLQASAIYKMNKIKLVGSQISCPMCKNTFNKKTYHKSFCSNQKTTHHFSCKDRFWDGIKFFSIDVDAASVSNCFPTCPDCKMKMTKLAFNVWMCSCKKPH